jgi:hypothetical protein
MKVQLPFRAAHLVEPFYALLPDFTKTALESGVKRYVFEPDPSAPLSTFWGFIGLDPVDRYFLHGIGLSAVDWKVGDNKQIPVTLTGAPSHKCNLSLAEPDPDNEGTYALGPHVRGPLADPSAGDVHVQVTRVVGGLQFKVQQSSGPPTFPGAAVDVALDGATAKAVWQDLQDHDGADLGFHGENVDPLQVIFPGGATEHADLGVGDTWIFRAPGAWQTPAIALAPAAPQMTSAHWRIRVREKGSGPWLEKRFTDGDVSVQQPVDLDRGNGSRYPWAASRVGRVTPKVGLKRSLFDRFFDKLNIASARLEVEVIFESGLIGTTNTYREGLKIAMPSARIDSRKSSVANDKQVPEEVVLIGETDAEGATSVTVTILCARDWTPPA